MSLLDPDQVGWFAARQPAVIRILADELPEGGDAYAVALDGAWRLASVFELRDGVAPRRLEDESLLRARAAVAAESISGQVRADGGAARQTELCLWIAAYVVDPPVPLTRDEIHAVGDVLIAVLYAFDAATRGPAAVCWPALVS